MEIEKALLKGLPVGRVLGIDLSVGHLGWFSLTTGLVKRAEEFGFISQEKRDWVGGFQSARDLGLSERLFLLGKQFEGRKRTDIYQMNRISLWYDYFLSFAEECIYRGVVKAFVEGYAFSSQGNSLFQIGEVAGIFKAVFLKAGICVQTVPPTMAKKKAGKGNASKEFMVKAAIKEGISIPESLIRVTGKGLFEGPGVDVADAFWVLKAGLDTCIVENKELAQGKRRQFRLH